jgi:hypothetical protein
MAVAFADADAGCQARYDHQSPLVEIYALAHDGCDEGLLELDFREAGQCEIVFFGVTAKLIGSGAGRWLMNRTLELSWSRPIARLAAHLHPRSSGSGSVLSALGLSSLPAAGRDRGRSGSTAPRRAMPRGMFRSSCKAAGLLLTVITRESGCSRIPEASAIEPQGRSVLDTPLFAGE